MSVYPNPDPRLEDEPERFPTGDPLNPNRPEDVPEDTVRVYERPDEDESTGTNLVTIMVGLIFLIVLGYLAYQLIF